MASLYEEIQRELREEGYLTVFLQKVSEKDKIFLEDLLMKQFLEVYQKDIDCLVTDYSSPGVLCPICQK